MARVNCEIVLCSLPTRNAILQIIRNLTTAVTKLVHGLMKMPRCVVDIDSKDYIKSNVLLNPKNFPRLVRYSIDEDRP